MNPHLRMSFEYGQLSITANGDFSQKRIEYTLKKDNTLRYLNNGMNEFPARFA